MFSFAILFAVDMAFIMRESLQAFQIGKEMSFALARRQVAVKLSSNTAADIILPRSNALGSAALFIVASARQLNPNMLERQLQALKSFNTVTCVVTFEVFRSYSEFCYGHNHYPDQLKMAMVPEESVVPFVFKLFSEAKARVKDSKGGAAASQQPNTFNDAKPTSLSEQQKAVANTPANQSRFDDNAVVRAAQVYLQARLNEVVSRHCARQLLQCHRNIKSISETSDGLLKSFVAKSRQSEFQSALQ